MPFEEAAALPVAVETAARALDLLGVGSGQTLIINAAAGGVGTVAVQLARARGITVYGTAGPGNHDYLRGLGATVDVMPQRPDAPDMVFAMNLGLGVVGTGPEGPAPHVVMSHMRFAQRRMETRLGRAFAR